MPSVQKKYKNTEPKKKKSSRSKLESSFTPDKKRMTALTASGTETNIGDRDGRMAAARQDKLDEDVKKAGGADAYRKKIKKTKSNLIKYKGKYVRKDSAMGKKALAERNKK